MGVGVGGQEGRVRIFVFLLGHELLMSLWFEAGLEEVHRFVILSNL